MSSNDMYQEIQLKVNQLFAKPVKLLLAIKTGDLFDASGNLTGSELVEMIGSSCLYVQLTNQERTSSHDEFQSENQEGT
jgi:hypothetical protein